MFSILMLDDEPHVLSALRRALRLPLGDAVAIETFTDPHEALARADSHRFDLFMSDFRMPLMDGISFLRFARELQPDARRIIVSASTEINGVMTAINDLEVFRYIVKPWTSSLLIEDVRAALNQAPRARVPSPAEAAAAEASHVHAFRIEAERRRLEALEPGLTDVTWGPLGEVVVSPHSNFIP